MLIPRRIPVLTPFLFVRLRKAHADRGRFTDDIGAMDRFLSGCRNVDRRELDKPETAMFSSDRISDL